MASTSADELNIFDLRYIFGWMVRKLEYYNGMDIEFVKMLKQLFPLHYQSKRQMIKKISSKTGNWNVKITICD